MTRTDFDGYSLVFHTDYIEIIFQHGAHFNEDEFLHCFKLKQQQYQQQKVGILVTREDINASYSFDPMFLLYHKNTLEGHTNWVVVASTDAIDYQNLVYVTQFTNLPCKYLPTKEKALQWITSYKKTNP